MNTGMLLLIIYLVLSLCIPVVMWYNKPWLIKKQREYEGLINYKLFTKILFLIPGFGTTLVLLFLIAMVHRELKRLLGYSLERLEDK